MSSSVEDTIGLSSELDATVLKRSNDSDSDGINSSDILIQDTWEAKVRLSPSRILDAASKMIRSM